MSIRKGRLTSQGLLATPVNFPIATIHAFAGTSAPDGWAMCDGSEVSKTQYAALYAVIGDTYGTPVDSNNFVLPDLRGEFLRGLDDMGTAAGARGKDVDGTARTVGQEQSHASEALSGTFEVKKNAGSFQVRDASGVFTKDNGPTVTGNNAYNATAYSTDRVTFSNSSINTSNNETRPVNIAINYIIKL